MRIIITLFIVIFLVIITACQVQDEGAVLDTSKLKEFNEETETGIYLAPSLKTALDSLPFKVDLPKEFPFDSSGFEVLSLIHI